MNIFKTKYLLHSLVVTLAIVFSACSDSDDKTENVELGLTLTKPTVTATDSPQFIRVTAQGSWTLAIDFGEFEDEEEQPDPWAFVNPSSGSGSKNDVELSYNNNPDEAARAAEIVLSSANGLEVRATLIQRGTGGNSVEIDLAKAKWLELPNVVQRKDCMYASHSFTSEGVDVRNYSICYDTVEKVSYWVAYPLHNFYLTGSSSSSSWKFDPEVPRDFQIDLRTYSYQGWLAPQWKHQRGHQIANADRKIAAANSQTYYSTNSTPQRQDFNEKGWANLEIWVRTKVTAQTDTLYVVTGAILKTVGGNETVIYDSERNNPSNKIAVPNYYYKVLLQKHSANTTGTPYRAIGFWYVHEPNNSKDYAAYAKTIREIEELTGFDFFANLPKAEQDLFETTLRLSDWAL